MKNEQKLIKKYKKMLNSKFINEDNKEDVLLKQMIDTLAITMVECEQTKAEINKTGWTAIDRYGQPIPNKLIPLYQKHKNIVNNQIKDLIKITSIDKVDTEGLLDITKFL